jgi:hypothetical protein
MRKPSFASLLGVFAAVCLLMACSPRFNWRDFHSADAGYSVLFPGKPSTLTRTVDLDGTKLSMTMNAAEVDGVSFAVGSAAVPDAAKAQAALGAMQAALVNNIGATVKRQSASSTVSTTGAVSRRNSIIEVEAVGAQHGVPVLLVGRFVARDRRIYQIIVMGRESQVSRESVDTFLNSFKLD